MRVWAYMTIMLGAMIFLYFLGFHPVGSDEVLNDAGVYIEPTNGTLMNADMGNSGWFNKLFNLSDGLILLAGAGLAFTVGYFTKTFDWKLAILPFMTLYVTKFVQFGNSIINWAITSNERWLIALISTIFIPLIVMFVFSLVEWFAGGAAD